MAIDAALLDRTIATGEAFLRCYRWDPHCLSFGRHEPARKRYDVSRIKALGLDCVRRPTGGRAVWHARELTYSVTAPLGAFGGLREAYRAIHAMIARALQDIGAAPLLAADSSRTPGLGSGPCFAAPVGGEVLVRNRKVVGSAQLGADHAFLQHGSVLLDDDQSLVAELAGAAPETGNPGGLSRLIGRPLSFDEMAHSMERAAEEAFGLVARGDAPRDLAAGIERHAGRFRSEEWTWMR
jgi:lipoate-protein ligase A